MLGGRGGADIPIAAVDVDAAAAAFVAYCSPATDVGSATTPPSLSLQIAPLMPLPQIHQGWALYCHTRGEAACAFRGGRL